MSWRLNWQTCSKDAGDVILSAIDTIVTTQKEIIAPQGENVQQRVFRHLYAGIEFKDGSLMHCIVA